MADPGIHVPSSIHMESKLGEVFAIAEGRHPDAIAEWIPERRRAGGRRSDAVMNEF
jgi:hypothetical protein